MDQPVDRTLHLLKNGFTNMSQDDFTLLLELHQQLGLVFVNLAGEHINTARMAKSLDYLANVINNNANKITTNNATYETKDNSKQSKHTTNHKTKTTPKTNSRKQDESQEFQISDEEHEGEQDEHLPKRGVITMEIVNNKIIYLLDGEQLKFKKLKETTIYHQRWQANFKALKDFYERHGHLKVTRSTEGRSELGNWITEQRRKLKRGKISQKQFEQLNELGKEG